MIPRTFYASAEASPTAPTIGLLQPPAADLGVAHYANGVFRRWGAPVAPMGKTPMAARAGLWAAGAALRRMGVVEGAIDKFERSFELGAQT